MGVYLGVCGVDCVDDGRAVESPAHESVGRQDKNLGSCSRVEPIKYGSRKGVDVRQRKAYRHERVRWWPVRFYLEAED